MVAFGEFLWLICCVMSFDCLHGLEVGGWVLCGGFWWFSVVFGGCLGFVLSGVGWCNIHSWLDLVWVLGFGFNWLDLGFGGFLASGFCGV